MNKANRILTLIWFACVMIVATFALWDGITWFIDGWWEDFLWEAELCLIASAFVLSGIFANAFIVPAIKYFRRKGDKNEDKKTDED